MTKKEQMLEMMKIYEGKDWVCDHSMDCPYIGESKVHCVSCLTVEPFYDAGYRKVDGTHYISMEWHEEQVQQAQDEIENLKLQLQHAQENEEVLTKNAEEVAKQAVRDFAERLEIMSVPMYTVNGEPRDRAVFIEQIDEYLKKVLCKEVQL